jgi:hypothetical protein
MHVRLADVADKSDDELIGFVEEHNALAVRTAWAPYEILEALNFPPFSSAETFFTPPVNGAEEAVDELAQRFAVDFHSPWVPPHPFAGALEELGKVGGVDGTPVGLLTLMQIMTHLGPSEETPQKWKDWWTRAKTIDFPIMETLAELRYGALLVRDTLAAVRWAMYEAPEPSWKARFWKFAEPPATPATALEFACEVITHALREYAPRVHAVDEDLIEDPETLVRIGTYRGGSLLIFCLTSIAVDIQHRGDWSFCPAPNCGKPFKRQRGRGHHRRIGAIYCSPECQRKASKLRARERAAGQSQRLVLPSQDDP